MPRVLLSSPDQKAHLRPEPDPDDQWWTLRHVAEPDRPAWYASFGARTAVELIAASTDALSDPAPAADAPCDPYGALRQAQFGAHTPPHPCRRVHATLGDPKPVHRTDSGRSLPILDPNVVIRPTTDVLAAYVAGALEDRVHSLAARHTTTPTASIRSRPAPPRHDRSR
ncbi:DUF317 domain-containing protein [Streptomyces sp. A244]|uniref:DUF317 domain-containing protein n=1 Tax=Streptomyces sp. A244 TaxID=2137016 RepID=UPI0026C3BF17|nr:DUF317 domain-containing protein [Streptomyces sp. A244]